MDAKTLFQHCGDVVLADVQHYTSKMINEMENESKDGRTYKCHGRVFNMRVVNIQSNYDEVISSAQFALDNQYDVQVLDMIAECYKKGKVKREFFGSGTWELTKIQ